MIFGWLTHLFTTVNEFLHHPLRVLGVCLTVAFISLVVEGSLFQLWSLHRDYSDIRQRIVDVREATEKLEMKIQRVGDPQFLELEARNRFDLVEEGDLIFVFAE